MTVESSGHDQLVFTLKEKCRTCYTCVRECPAKAIRIVSGQAEIIGMRCIGCGNCIKVCSQEAKVFANSVDDVLRLIHSDQRVAAIVAPSFPAEFMELKDHQYFVGMVRAIGFDIVAEVSFGADLVAKKYKKLIESNSEIGHISSDCPAIVSFVEKYYPQLVPQLAQIVSPMVATARVIRKKYGNDVKIVFIGPCVAKKSESTEVDEVLTFVELRQILSNLNITQENIKPDEFDPPFGGKGAIFPVSRGMIQTINLDDNIYRGNMIPAEGRISFQDAIREFESGSIRSQNLELLCCEGCIMGPGMLSRGNRFGKRTFISNYVKTKLNSLDKKQWEKDISEFQKLDFSQKFEEKDQRLTLPSPDEINKVLESMGKKSLQDHLNCGACGYDSCEEHAIAIIRGLAENEMCLPYTIDKLHNSVNELAVSNEKLANMQQVLKQTEKLAHMGQLSAGIAHELNNPLGVVIMYANIILDETTPDSPLRKDLELIVEQTARCKKIVNNLLNFARKNQVNYEYFDAAKLIELSMNSLIVPDNISVNIQTRMKDQMIYLDPEQMIQVLTNLLRNAFDAMPDGGKVRIELTDENEMAGIIVSDTGSGIKKENLEKVFEPFFTTKPIGKGTGLGLATIYGIIKMHKGQITVQSNADPEKGATGTIFRISLPKTSRKTLIDFK